jgi:hypothetical protein
MTGWILDVLAGAGAWLRPLTTLMAFVSVGTLLAAQVLLVSALLVAFVWERRRGVTAI